MKKRSSGSELDSLIKSQTRDMRADAKLTGEIRGKDKRRAKRERLTLAEREKEVNFDGIDPIN
jgi:hypothetical protein